MPGNLTCKYHRTLAIASRPGAPLLWVNVPSLQTQHKRLKYASLSQCGINIVTRSRPMDKKKCSFANGRQLLVRF